MMQNVIKDIQDYFDFYGCKDKVVLVHNIFPNSSLSKDTLFIKYHSGAGGFTLDTSTMSQVELSNFKFRHVFGK